MEPLLKTNKTCITFNKGKPNEFVALKDVNIEIFPNEYIFFGPSGSGNQLSCTLFWFTKADGGRNLREGQSLFDF